MNQVSGHCYPPHSLSVPIFAIIYWTSCLQRKKKEEREREGECMIINLCTCTCVRECRDNYYIIHMYSMYNIQKIFNVNYSQAQHSTWMHSHTHAHNVACEWDLITNEHVFVRTTINE